MKNAFTHIALSMVIAAIAVQSIAQTRDTDIRRLYANKVLLLDASGSMGPYYTTYRSQFISFISSLIDEITTTGDSLAILTFSRNEPARGIQSPQFLTEGRIEDRTLNAKSLDELLQTLHHNPAANTDMWEAIQAIRHRLDRGGGGVIWLLTDNIQDPTNRIDERNLQTFYREIRGDDSIQKINVFPVMGDYPGCQLPILYGMIYAPRTISSMILRNTPIDVNLGRLTNSLSIYCKPLDREMLELVYPGYNGIILDDVRECTSTEKRCEGLRIKSSYPSHRVRSDRIRAEITLISSSDKSIVLGGNRIAIQPRILDVPSQGTSEQVYSIAFSLEPICPSFSLSSCFNSTFEIRGVLSIKADGVTFSLDERLIEIMDRTYGLHQLPHFFQPRLTEVTSKTFPITIIVRYSLSRTLLGLGIPLAITILVIALLLYAWKNPKRFELMVDGKPHPVRSLRWFGERWKVYASESGEDVLIGTILYAWFRGMQFRVQRPYRFAGKAERSIKLPSRSIEFVLEKDGLAHTVIYQSLARGLQPEEPEAGERETYA